MSHFDIFCVVMAAAVAIPPIALAVSNSDWYEHRRALRKLRYEAELRAHQRAHLQALQERVQESEDR